MRLGKEVKRDTQLIILSVAILTIVTLSFSYSAFFTVQSLSTVQEIETGNLNVTISVDNTKSISQDEELFPVSDADGVDENGNYSKLTLINEGDLDADFSITISYDFDKLRNIKGYSSMSDSDLVNYLVSFDYLRIGIYDDTFSNWVNFSDSGTTNYVTIGSLTSSNGNNYKYPILRDIVYSDDNANNDESGTKKSQRVFKIFIWLSDETPTSEIGKYVYLKLGVKSAAGTETITKELDS